MSTRPECMSKFIREVVSSESPGFRLSVEVLIRSQLKLSDAFDFIRDRDLHRGTAFLVMLRNIIATMLLALLYIVNNRHRKKIPPGTYGLVREGFDYTNQSRMFSFLNVVMKRTTSLNNYKKYV